LPANRVGFLSHDVRVVHHVLAHSAAPIRLRFCAHGINCDRAEMILGLVLLDIVSSERCARLTAVSLSNPSAVPARTTQAADAGAP